MNQSPPTLRYRLIAFAVLAATVSIVSCGQRDPTFRPTISVTLPHGDVVVTSSVPGAAISLDRRATGQVTPDTLHALLAGGHRIGVYLGGYYTASDTIDVVAGAVQTLAFDLEAIPTAGDLAVTAPWPAQILIDGSPTGVTVPDTVKGIPAGDHIVALDLPGFAPMPASRTVTITAGATSSASFELTVPRRVLCEDFSNYDCAPCPAADEALQSMIAAENAAAPGRVVSINPHLYYPSLADPFYKFNRASNCSRSWTYSVGPLPEVHVDGAMVDPPDASHLQAAVTARSATAPVALGVRGTLSGSGYQVAVDVWGVGSFPSSLQLTTCIVERSVSLVPAGSNGQSTYTNVLRALLPGPSVFATPIPDTTCTQGSRPGGVAVTLASGEHQHFDFTWSVPGGVDPSRVAAIAFVQDLATNQIVQAGMTFDPVTVPSTMVLQRLRQARIAEGHAPHAWAASRSIQHHPQHELHGRAVSR